MATDNGACETFGGPPIKTAITMGGIIIAYTDGDFVTAVELGRYAIRHKNNDSPDGQKG